MFYHDSRGIIIVTLSVLVWIMETIKHAFDVLIFYIQI